MTGKRENPKNIVSKLHQVEVSHRQGATSAKDVRQIGVTQRTFYRWRKQYGRNLLIFSDENPPLHARSVQILADMSRWSSALRASLLIDVRRWIDRIKRIDARNLKAAI